MLSVNLFKPTMIAAAAVCLVVSSASLSRAQSNLFSVTNLTQSPAPVLAGQEAFFSATLTNLDPNNAVTLGSLSLDFNETFFTQDVDDDYNNNANGLVTLAAYNASDPSASQYSGEVFGVITDPATPADTYTESLTISDAAGDFPPLAAQDFQIAVAAPAAAPEPASFLPLLFGGLGLGLFALKARRRAAQSA